MIEDKSDEQIVLRRKKRYVVNVKQEPAIPKLKPAKQPKNVKSKQSTKKKEKKVKQPPPVKKVKQPPPAKKDITQKKLLKKQAATFLQTNFPAAFDTPKPLSIGIHDELCAKVSDDEKKLVKIGLNYLCHRKAYIKSLITEDNRFDMNGKVKGSVSPEEKALAIKKINIMEEKEKQCLSGTE